jgi:magnesium transporter
MRHDVLVANGCRWVDVVGPTRAELHDLATEFSLPPSVVEDCLDPEHLPKYERFEGATFVILRARDLAAPDDASTVQELTRKVAVFQREGLVLTVHRIDLAEIGVIRDRFRAATGTATQHAILAALVLAALDSYEKPLDATQGVLDQFEEGVFDEDIPAPTLRDAFNLKRRVTLTRRIFWQTGVVLQKLSPPTERHDPLYQEMRETADAYLFWVEQLLDQVNQLLQMHLAMSSNKTNEVMRILTVFSAFFLPLTFIAGVYGMNFRHMPELAQRWGYPAVMLLMFGLCAGIFSWFRRRGWL